MSKHPDTQVDTSRCLVCGYEGTEHMGYGTVCWEMLMQSRDEALALLREAEKALRRLTGTLADDVTHHSVIEPCATCEARDEARGATIAIRSFLARYAGVKGETE
jgi:hypothetical protein